MAVLIFVSSFVSPHSSLLILCVIHSFFRSFVLLLLFLASDPVLSGLPFCSFFFIWFCWPTIRFWVLSKCSRTHITTRQDRPENSTEFMRSNLYPHNLYVCDESQSMNGENIAETLPALKRKAKC